MKNVITLYPKLVASLAVLLLAWPAMVFAQATPTSKQVPPPGIEVPAADAAELKAGIDKLGRSIDDLRRQGGGGSSQSLLADVEVFHKAARYALDYHEFFSPKEISAAKEQLKLGSERAEQLRSGKPGWTSATGPLVLGYVSRIDGSVQPYGLIVPDDWKPGDKTPRPLYLWFHGRGDTISEVNFIGGRLKGKHDFSPANAFELHLYGRFCNASKFAGEIDCFEAMADAQRRYSIDSNRIVEMGFSMGGATGWHMAAHYPGTWAVGSAGAGFAETEIYAKVDDPKKTPPPAWERTLYRLYDTNIIAANFGNLPFIAYSGEIDPQKQSADLMEKALADDGLKLERLIGPGVGHKYEPETKKELSRRIDAYVAKGRDPLPKHIRFATYTTRYNECKWLRIDALDAHWEKAEVDATLADHGGFQIKTANVAGLTIALPEGPAPFDKGHAVPVVIDGQNVVAPVFADRWSVSFEKSGGKWQAVPSERAAAGLTKRHGLQGPIDDAFMDSFIFVRPTGKAWNEKVGAWSQSELTHAVEAWRTVFRGDARVKDDTALTADDVKNANLVLWGDPGSNKALAQLLPKLPVQWTRDKLTMGAQSASAADHAPILVYPNPVNPNRYIVINSGFTFRMGARTSNSLQTPKLPDWALIDLNTAADENWPGKVAAAGFFDERWQWKH